MTMFRIMFCMALGACVSSPMGATGEGVSSVPTNDPGAETEETPREVRPRAEASRIGEQCFPLGFLTEGDLISADHEYALYKRGPQEWLLIHQGTECAVTSVSLRELLDEDQYAAFLLNRNGFFRAFSLDGLCGSRQRCMFLELPGAFDASRVMSRLNAFLTRREGYCFGVRIFSSG